MTFPWLWHVTSLPQFSCLQQKASYQPSFPACFSLLGILKGSVLTRDQTRTRFRKQSAPCKHKPLSYWQQITLRFSNHFPGTQTLCRLSLSHVYGDWQFSKCLHITGSYSILPNTSNDFSPSFQIPTPLLILSTTLCQLSGAVIPGTAPYYESGIRPAT